ncbi:DUF1934 domain-containing protein [Erysipelothrix sp. HDW6C]|uniref:DUF1934 domain-containing protein n=1 Tax=Erysipelothrix sp. HDW6C TaxID=2714930 RepID=UPI001F0F1292|nr:DUF1934 domain-containing protein [Erysipelothrix sp. HDW6C]
MKITITQNSRDNRSKVVDNAATMDDYGSYRRMTYAEENGAIVVIDILSDEISLKRQDTWLTQGLFHRFDKTEMLVSNEHGTVIFDVNVEEMQIEENLLYIRYHLSQGNERIDTLEFECRWEPEV